MSPEYYDKLRYDAYRKAIPDRHKVWCDMYKQCRTNLSLYGIQAPLPVPANRKLFLIATLKGSSRFGYNKDAGKVYCKGWRTCLHSS